MDKNQLKSDEGSDYPLVIFEANYFHFLHPKILGHKKEHSGPKEQYHHDDSDHRKYGLGDIGLFELFLSKIGKIDQIRKGCRGNHEKYYNGYCERYTILAYLSKFLLIDQASPELELYFDGRFAYFALEPFMFHLALLFFRLESIISMSDPLIVTGFVHVEQGAWALAGHNKLVIALLFRRQTDPTQFLVVQANV